MVDQNPISFIEEFENTDFESIMDNDPDAFNSWGELKREDVKDSHRFIICRLFQYLASDPDSLQYKLAKKFFESFPRECSRVTKMNQSYQNSGRKIFPSHSTINFVVKHQGIKYRFEIDYLVDFRLNVYIYRFARINNYSY